MHWLPPCMLVAFPQRENWRHTLFLAYGAVGVICGDLSVSPIFVFDKTWALGHALMQVGVGKQGEGV